ncbi:unnamed protein product [Bemisia tabaci]|uniref:Uncharacterized protein n=1 Tax=Bemisia tabaci TaxID=7038 RepID=A0A9P0AIS4_BEMTA|nr:unnamed protein product [Bemisia tabaci]
MSLSSNGRGGRSPRRHLHLRKHKSPDGRMLLQLHTSGWTKLHKIEINYGDIVVCHTHTYGTFKRPKTHFFLAVSGHELQHVYPIPGDPSERGVIVIEDKAKIPHKFHSFLDCDSCKNLGNGRYDKQATSLRAEKWVDRYTFYNEDSCASYHWVVYWVTGRVPEPKIYIPGFNPRLNMVCRLKNIKTSPEPLGTDTKISDETLSKLATISDEDVLAEIFKNESNQSDTESTGRYSDNGIAIEHP